MAERQDWTDALLRDVAARPAVPDGDFMAALLAQAEAAQPRPATAARPVVRAPNRMPLWGWLWPSGGLAAALACGLWLGLSPQSFMAPYLYEADLAVEPYQILDLYAALEETR